MKFKDLSEAEIRRIFFRPEIVHEFEARYNVSVCNLCLGIGRCEKICATCKKRWDLFRHWFNDYEAEDNDAYLE